ncbi:MAG: hypothetical protein ACREOE_20530 [Gemmatimonadales bacterium]
MACWWGDPDPASVVAAERGPDGRFHDGLLMDLLRPELAREAG